MIHNIYYKFQVYNILIQYFYILLHLELLENVGYVPGLYKIFLKLIYLIHCSLKSFNPYSEELIWYQLNFTLLVLTQCLSMLRIFRVLNEVSGLCLLPRFAVSTTSFLSNIFFLWPAKGTDLISTFLLQD